MQIHLTEQLDSRIVKLLSSKPDQSVSDLHTKLGAYSVQALYKELRKLQQNGVVVKQRNSYGLRLPWLLELANFAESSIMHYEAKALNFDQKNKQVWNFQNPLKLNDFWSQILLLLVKKSPSKILYGWNPHLWFHLAQTEKEEQYVKSLGIAKSKLYLVIGGNGYLDRWAEKYLNPSIVEYVLGKKAFEDQNIYLNIIDDFVMRVKLDAKVTRAIHELYEDTKAAEDFNIQKIVGLFSQKSKNKIVLECNPQKAHIYRNKFKRFFGTKPSKY